MATELIEYGPGTGRSSWFDQQERRALNLLSWASGYGIWRDDMVSIDTRSYQGSVAGTGAIAKLIGELDITSGATANSYKEVFWDDGTGVDLFIPGGTSGEWAIYGRLRFTDLDAQTRCTFGVRDTAGTGFVRLGCVGSVSATNFVLQTDNGSIDSGVADDANPHDWMVVRKGTTTSLYIDNAVKGTPADLFPQAACGAHAIASNGTTAAVRKTGLMFVGAVFPRRTT